MNEKIEVDREALIELHRVQNLAALTEIVLRGELTEKQAMQAHHAFMKSNALRQLVDRDVEYLDAWMLGRVH